MTSTREHRLELVLRVRDLENEKQTLERMLAEKNASGERISEQISERLDQSLVVTTDVPVSANHSATDDLTPPVCTAQSRVLDSRTYRGPNTAMGHTVDTEDLVLLRSIDDRLFAMNEKARETATRVAETSARVVASDERMQRIERNQPGGRFWVIVERVLITLATTMLGYQTVQDRVVNRVPDRTEERLLDVHELRIAPLDGPVPFVRTATTP
jgi:hypothetical protein